MRLFAAFYLLLTSQIIFAAGAFTIKDYYIRLQINEKGYIEIEEKIKVNFYEQRRGIIRSIPYKFEVAANEFNTERAEGFETVGKSIQTSITDVKVLDWDYEVNKSNGVCHIKIGNPNRRIIGDQIYIIKYKVHDPINFFSNHAELYYNLIGTEWGVPIDTVNFEILFPKDIPGTPENNIFTGTRGSTENNSFSQWTTARSLVGHSTKKLNINEGLTVGIKFPKDLILKENSSSKGKWWIGLLPLLFTGLFYWIWTRFGKDERFSIQTEFTAPQGVSPAVAGYLMNDRHKKRDLTSLIPYWGEKGYLKITEHEKSGFLGFSKSKELEFTQLKELPSEAPNHEHRMFEGLFSCGSPVMLSDLKDNIYQKMEYSSQELEHYIDAKKYYTESGNLWRTLMLVISFALIGIGIFGIITFSSAGNYPYLYFSIGLVLSALPGFLIFSHMPKKTRIGTDIYKKLCGFKEFITTVEKEKLEMFLKEDPGYFDKVLPYAIVFNVAQEWKKRFEGLEVPPPQWYVGSSPHFNYLYYMNTIDHALDDVSDSIYSVPNTSGSAGSGGSFGDFGGGFSGGGFGGGGGSDW
ncbi:MAG: DUF2207 domain-containing protein [Saprospiraceae bacterium]|nr:DUF2207 domain-containing protein [Saprospiraceae bacterium]